MQFWALIADSFRESKDRKIFWVMLILSVLVAAGMFCIAFEENKINFMFGAWVVETSYFTGITGLRNDRIAAILVDGIMDTVLGTIGILLSIVATASFFPTFLERGSIDVALSKPIPRWRLFLCRYAGGMVFVAVHATIFVGLTFLVAGIRWGTWLPGYLLSIPLMVLLFSYLYCISAATAVFTRSTVAAIMITMFAWVAIGTIQAMDDGFEIHPHWKENQKLHKGIKTARWIAPKTSDVVILAKKWSHAATSWITDAADADTEEDKAVMKAAEEIERKRAEMSPVLTIGSSLFFEAAIVLLAMFKFSRTDY